MRRTRLLEYLFANPLILVGIGVVVVAVIADIIWQNINEANAAETQRQKERQRPDSIWRD